MAQKSKRFREIEKQVDKSKTYPLAEAIEILKKCHTDVKTVKPLKFDQSVDVILITGVDIRRPEQQVRGTVSLPNGIGKAVKVLVFARGEKAKEALDAGADFVGAEDLFEKINAGWTDFDLSISTPDMMRDVGKVSRILGPRGLMPSPKSGTVTLQIAKAVSEAKQGKVEFSSGKSGVIQNMVGKLTSFTTEQLEQNIRAFIGAVSKAKPPTAKGQYLKSIVVSSTMGPGIKIDLKSVEETKA